MTQSNGKEMSFTFSTNKTAHKAYVHVSLDDDLESIRFNVDLDSLPGMNKDGHELVVKFKLEYFDNNNTFWTDSNGLEMQKRVLNYRPTWDIQKDQNYSLDNVTANFYPVTSAISMKDVTDPSR
jgi:hypothetical protein